MKIVYIASAMTENGEMIQENAYTNSELALERATIMCREIKEQMGWEATPDAMPMELYEDGDVTPDTISTEN